MPEWLSFFKWVKPKEWIFAFYRNEIDKEIQKHTEGYRQNIEDLKEWNETTRSLIKKISDLEVEKITKEADRDVAKSQEEAKDWKSRYYFSVHDLISAAAYIAVKAHLNPMSWELDKLNLKPELLELVEKIKADIPPPPTRQGPPLFTPLVGNLLTQDQEDAKGESRLKNRMTGKK